MILNNKYFKSIMVSIIFLYGCYSFSQTSDLLRVEYLNIPNSSSKNSVERFRGFFQLPLKIKENNFLIISGDYRTTNLEFNNVPFLTKDLENIQRVEASIGYCLFKQEGWTYAINAGLRLASNFAGRLVKDDYIYLANIYAIRDRTKDVAEGSKPNRLILGLNYTTTPGRDFPLPIINYYREFHPDWTYTLGVPKTNIRYKATKTNHIQAFLTLDNFHANIQKNVIVDNKLAEHMSMTTILAGIGYEHYFTDHLLYYGYLAYTVSNDHRLRDNERNDIYTFEDQPSVYFRTGIKFKI